MGAARQSCDVPEIDRPAPTASALVSSNCALVKVAILQLLTVIGHECVYETKRIKPGIKAGAIENIHRRLGR